MSTCPALRPRWCPSSLAMSQERTAAFRWMHYVGFLSPRVGRLSAWTTVIHISGLNLTACTLATPGIEHPITGMHAGSLRTCRLNFGPVGIALSLLPVAHRLGNVNEFQNLLCSFIPSLRIYLGASTQSLCSAGFSTTIVSIIFAHLVPAILAGTAKINTFHFRRSLCA